MRRRTTIFVVTALLLLAPVAPVVASDFVSGNPELRYSVADDTFQPNSRAELTVVAANDGDIDRGGPEKFEQQVQTARSVQMTVLEDRIQAPIEVKTGTVTTGSIDAGDASPFTFSLELGDVRPGTYTVPVQVRYRHARAVTYDSTDETEYVWLEERETVNLQVHVEDTAQFEVVSEGTNELFAGDTGSLDFTIVNTGTQTARRATVDLRSKASGVFFGTAARPERTTSVYVESLEPGETRNVSVQVGATSELSTGEFPVEAVVSYRNDNDILEESDPLTTGVLVRPERTFAIEGLSAPTLRVDESEVRVTGRLVNTGPGTARNVVATLQPTGPVTPTNGEAAVGDLEPGESTPVSFTVTVSGDANAGTNSFSFDVAYENADGDLRSTSDPIRKTVRIRPERTFAIEDLSAPTLRVDESEVQVTGRLVNTGPATARNVVATLQPTGPVTPTNGEAAVGDLEPGESTPVSFTVDVSSDAEPGVNSFSFDVAYENAGGDLRTAGKPLRKTVRIHPERDRFAVHDVSTTVTPGGKATLTANVTYRGDDPISAVNVKLFASDPLSTSDDGAYLGSMAPGETKMATFRVSAGSESLVKEYAASIEVRYDEADGDTRFSDGHSIGVPVNEPAEGPPIPPIAIVVGVVVVLVVAGLWYRRR